MNRDGIAEPRHPDAPSAPDRGEAHVWRVELPTPGGRAAARAALREILGAYLGEAPDAIALKVGEAGKPGLAASPAALSFNLSHSRGLALVAVATGGVEIGVDVEGIRPRRDLLRLAARWLPDEDAAAVAAAADDEREGTFYAAWTRFEARAKCTGAGLSGPPPGPEVVALPLKIDRGYAAALATVGTAPTSIRRLDLARSGTR
ncbi:MAG TPA: 4'-phosphopantetheinyl transferase superfamily protein [Solirubrobacterales bacterium]|nr:4'-phosphopantetheinyl transferase superfamily protein [Solirubrobacterales bacterium]